jgi:hypothetical protein
VHQQEQQTAEARNGLMAMVHGRHWKKGTVPGKRRTREDPPPGDSGLRGAPEDCR